MKCFIACLTGTTAVVPVLPFGSHKGCHPGSVLSPPEGCTHNPECVTLESAFEINFYNELVLELCFLHQVPPCK